MNDEPRAYIFAGANASGKSTFIAHLINQNIVHGEFINPDIILKEELRLPETVENYMRAFQIAEQKTEKLIKNRKDLVIETVFSTQRKIDLVKNLKNKGYHVTLFFTGTETADINLLYLRRRVESGGHDVPVRKLLERRKRGFENIKKIIEENIVECIVFIDNSIIGEPPQVIKSLYKGKLCFLNDNFNRNITWIENIVSAEALEEIDSSEVPYEHLQMCMDIVKKSDEFHNILKKSYNEKNSILSKKENPHVEEKSKESKAGGNDMPGF